MNALPTEVDHFIEQWFGEPRQEVRAMIYRWMGYAWDDGYLRGSFEDPGDFGRAENPYTTNPFAASDEPVAAVRLAMQMLRETDPSPAALTEIERIEEEWKP